MADKPSKEDLQRVAAAALQKLNEGDEQGAKQLSRMIEKLSEEDKD